MNVEKEEKTMNRKVIKIVSILLMVVMAVTMLSTSVFAAKSQDLDVGMFDTLQDNSTASESAKKIIGALISIAQVIGVGVAIIMLIVMAIKYISAAPTEKAEIKKSITIYVVGAIVLFAATGILEIIKNFATVNI